MEHVHPNWTEVATPHGSLPALMGLARRGPGSGLCTFRHLSQPFHAVIRDVSFSCGLPGEPVAPGDPRACCPKGEAPEAAPEVVSSFVLLFLPAPQDSRRLRAALWSSLPLEQVLPAAQRRPSWLGGPGRGPLSPGPYLRPVPGSRVCVCVCVEAGPLLFHACAPHWGHLVMAPHGAG